MFPSYIMSTDFLTHFRVPIPCVPRYGEKHLSDLVLRVFTLPSIPGKNPLTLVFKVVRDILVFNISYSHFTLVRLYWQLRGIEPLNCHSYPSPPRGRMGYLGEMR